MQVSELVVGSGETLAIGAGSNLQAAGVVHVADGGMIRIADNGILSIRNLATPTPEQIERFSRALAEQLTGPSSEMQAFMRQVTAPVSPSFAEQLSGSSSEMQALSAAIQALSAALAPVSPPEWLSAALAPVSHELLSAVGAGLRPLSGITLPSYLPEQRRRQPEPPAEVQVVSLAQADEWEEAKEMLTRVLTLGRATPQQIVHWLLQVNRGSQAPPTWEFIKALGEDFERNGRKFENMAAFGRKHNIQSRTTLNSYLKDYEAATGRQVRPGQGRAKRRKGK